MTADTNLSALLAELDAGATAGKWCQFHPSYTPEAVGTKLDWDISHQMSAVKDGNRKKLATWTHASDAHFAEVLVNAFRKGQLIPIADAEAMVAAEREACANLAESLAEMTEKEIKAATKFAVGGAVYDMIPTSRKARKIATAIRARGATE